MSKKIMDPHLWTLEGLFKAMYTIPVYQRPYSWDKAEVEVLLNDIIEAYESETKEEGYYTGNIIVFDNGKINGLIPRFDVIDGQQRITTFALILLVLYSICYEIGVESTDETLINIKKNLWKYVGRKYEKKLRTVSLSSMEKKCFSDLYDICFEEPQKLMQACAEYHVASDFDKRIIDNVKCIYAMIEKSISTTDEDAILDFAEYLLQYMQFIVIEANCKPNKVFSMFESINSKGKKLEEIDLIKTYIFSKLEEDLHETYLEKWGELIIKTKDNLYDYLSNYIKAYVHFYRNNINVLNFKAISKKELLEYFEEETESEAFKKLLDDMYNKVNYYIMLTSVDDAHKLVKSNKFRFYYRVFVKVAYKQPKALFLRALSEFDEGRLSKEDLVEIVSNTVAFMMKFLTISKRDSKDMITMFSTIMYETYQIDSVSKDVVLEAIATQLMLQGVTSERIKLDLRAMNAYEQNTMTTVALLSLFEATTKNEDGKVTTSYDQAVTAFEAYGNMLSLDHLLVQTPADDAIYKYRKDDEQNILRLLDGHDFPSGDIIDGMDYDLFTTRVLNLIGNLRLYYKDKNSGRQNTAIALKEYSDFNRYQDVVDRSNDIVNFLIDYCLPNPKVDVSKAPIGTRKKKNTGWLKMKELIAAGAVNVGDELYITVKPDKSKAILIDDKYVNYKGKKMTLNEWGCVVTGWKSVRIYTVVAIVGEIETLHDKRLRLVEM